MEVTGVEERGYMASTTLAGSRIDARIGRYSVDSAPRFAQTQSGANTIAFAADDDFLGFAKVTASDLDGQIVGAESNTPAAIDEQLSKTNRLAAAAAPPVPSDQGAPQREISAAAEPVSTFSLHVSDVSFRLAQAALARGETPDPARIRPEEFYNAFDYGDASPTSNEKVGSRIEQSAHPFLQQRNFVRIATKVASTGRGSSQPLHLTVLLDTSGSMEREDRIGLVRNALQSLGSLLTANDRVTLIGFARQPRLLTEALPGDQAAQLVKLASETPFTGGTNLEEALKLSAELAQRHFNPSAQNRVVLITDGAANLGNADPAQLATRIQSLRQQGIAFDACGVGTDGLDDSILEALTRKGDGRYYVLDATADGDAEFARRLAGAFRPAAENVKVQVRFNPARVGRYRLIGFEEHRLREEDFRNDQVDAAELAADEAAVALYQVEVLPNGTGDLGEVFVRFRDPASREMLERSWPILHEMNPRSFDRASRSIQLAGTAALLAEKLRGGEWADGLNLNELAPVANALRGHYAHEGRVQQLLWMFEQIRGSSSR
jgi:Mg-chelatase subunit ChlD